ncbi:hypothetical protein L3Q82_005106 [Scortum barcoo]|uniref:Uncharacterized protein n=1 Tax=Scortum barcoo TaxID=214431 RepID=A0ACB8VE93_9TELE|nr:hypothetical protein L3Q82_005106 [Scortum barcoo]
MPSRATSPPPLTVTVLAGLWLGLGRCGLPGSAGPGCDNGKLSLDRDLPAGVVYWDCSESAQQRGPSIDTVYDPEPASQVCMDKSISYNHTIPNSGAYRPVRAELGEYLYCPPQRWLNSLHNGAIVMLYHPCAPLHERLLLSALARSCLQRFIITPHPQLNKHTPIAVVSWGRTLELSTAASPEICDWLETTTSSRNELGGVSQSRKYNLLLTFSAEQLHADPEQRSARTKESLRRCCERTISSPLNGAMEAELESSEMKERLKQLKEDSKIRRIRAATRRNQKDVKEENETENTKIHVSSFLSNQTNRILSRPGDVQNYNSTHGPNSAPGNRTLSDPPGPEGAPSQSKIENINQSPTPRTTTPLGLYISETTLKSDSLGFGAAESQKGRLILETAAQQHSLKHPDLRNPTPSAGSDGPVGAVNSEHNHTARPEARALSSKHEGTDSVKHSDKHTADGVLKDSDVVDVKERELKQTHSDTHSHHKHQKTGYDSVSKSQSETPPHPPQHPNAQPATYLPSSYDCDGCKPGEHCECNQDAGAQARAAVVNNGLPRTPRTDEAVWAAAALGFLLVLLTLSVLHTRLYRHWRTTPSLYWHDPQQDYDSVAEAPPIPLRPPVR